MRASRFWSVLSAVLFLALCAYLGAALYARETAEAGFIAVRAEYTETLALRGIAIRTERSFAGRSAVPDAERVPAGTVFAVGADGTALRTDCSAIPFSSIDGLEYLSPACLSSLSVGELEAMLEKEAEPAEAVRLVTGRAWYYAALADAEGALPEGACCRLWIADIGRTLEAELISASAPAEGKRLLVFRLTAEDASCLCLRHFSSELDIKNVSGLLVPLAAVHTEGEEAFVNILAAGAEEAAAVDIIYTNAEYCLVAPKDSGALREGSRVLK